jgi:hypothetical protein
MAQRNPEESSNVQRVLELVEQLSAEEREELLYQLKLEDLRREIRKGLDSSDRGEVYEEEEAWIRLEEHRRQFQERQSK